MSMVTYSTDERVDVEVSTTMMTMRTSRRPSDPTRVIGLPTYEAGVEVWEVWTGDRYRIAIGGEVVHECETYLGGPPAAGVADLPDGSQVVWTLDGQFAVWIPRYPQRGLRVTLRDDAEWSRFGMVVEGDRAGHAIGSAVFPRRVALASR